MAFPSLVSSVFSANLAAIVSDISNKSQDDNEHDAVANSSAHGIDPAGNSPTSTPSIAAGSRVEPSKDGTAKIASDEESDDESDDDDISLELDSPGADLAGFLCALNLDNSKSKDTVSNKDDRDDASEVSEYSEDEFRDSEGEVKDDDDDDETDDDIDGSENEADKADNEADDGEKEKREKTTTDIVDTDTTVSSTDPHPEWREPPFTHDSKSTDPAHLQQYFITKMEIKSHGKLDFPGAVKKVLREYDSEALAAFCDLKGVRRFEFLRIRTENNGYHLAIMRFKQFVAITHYELENGYFNDVLAQFSPFMMFKIDKDGVWRLRRYLTTGITEYGRWGWNIRGVQPRFFPAADVKKDYGVRAMTSQFAKYMVDDEVGKPSDYEKVEMEFSYSKGGLTWTGGKRTGQDFLNY